MDPHSRLSQYNTRRPSLGPLAQTMRHLEHKSLLASLDPFQKPSTSSSTSTAVMSRSIVGKTGTKGFSAYATRPIASNSRVRRDEKYRRDMYLAFIDNALTQKAKGVSEHYDDLVRQFSPQYILANPQDSTVQLRSYLTALSHVVSKLDRSHRPLVDAILSMPWTIMDSAFVKAYISFVGMLVSARPEYLTLVSEKTAQSLTYQSGRKALSEGPAESSSSPLTRRVVYDRVHTLIQQLLSLVPTWPSMLYSVLTRNFPHKRQSQVEHVTYIRNLLRLSDYCPELGDRLLGLIIDRTIQIDVEIQVELEELEAAGTADTEEIFPLDIFDTIIGQEGETSDSEDDDDDDDDEEGGFSDLSSDAGSVDGDDGQKEQEIDTRQVQDMVTKLDCILEVIFKHLKERYSATENQDAGEMLHSPTPLTPLPTFSSYFSLPNSPTILVPSTSPPPPPTSPTLAEKEIDRDAQRTACFHSLLSIFERTIIRTFKSRYTQFVLFWYSSLSNRFRDHFLGTVVAKALLEVDQPVVTRAAAASYVGSYVSRANFVDRDETRNVVKLLCTFIENHLNAFDENVKLLEVGKDVAPQSAEQHAVFYATTQAVFLIFCFRWRDLLEHDPNDIGSEDIVAFDLMSHKTWLPQLNVIQRAVTSPLNPLKVCSANVVLQFALVSQKVAFIYCYPIIEANKRADYGSTTAFQPQGSTKQRRIPPTSSKQAFDADLATFFPFDPYKLPRSASYIESIYRDWTSVAIDDDEEEEEEEDDDNDAAVPNDYGGSPAVDAHMHGLSRSVDAVADVLGTSFGGMSISPVHHMQIPTVS